ncbi:hypothetical protein BU15DRAFT_83168 [Melanogaster broomeanus]|nr:hypothetical protein BU15DRAFT_83168 [Melanogaster broomeanus]
MSLVTPAPVSEVILPSPASAKELTILERVNPGSDRPVSRFAPGILVKFLWDHDAEVRAMQWVHGRLSVRTPRVLHHAPFSDTFVVPWDCTTKGVWYFFMEECPGVPLDTVIDGMTPTELDHMITTLGSVPSGPYNNRYMPYPWHPPHAFSSVKEYLEHYCSMFLEFCGSEPRSTSRNLLPGNILVDGSRITAIIDWETAGFYPETWEHSRMHDPGCMTPAWAHVLARIFPGPRREREIAVVYQIIGDLHSNSLFLA